MPPSGGGEPYCILARRCTGAGAGEEREPEPRPILTTLVERVSPGSSYRANEDRRERYQVKVRHNIISGACRVAAGHSINLSRL